MSHNNDKRYLGFQIAAGVGRRSASAYRPAANASQRRETAEAFPEPDHDDLPTFTAERAADARAYVKDWIQRHHGGLNRADIETILANRPPFEI